MNIDSIKNGIVIDHIEAGKSMTLYRDLNLEDLKNCSVAIIKNVISRKMGRKDIIKIDEEIHLNLDVLGFVAPTCTVNIIKNGKRVEKRHPALPKRLENIIKCKNPRCITTVERDIDDVFILTDAENRVYRCIYCESEAK